MKQYYDKFTKQECILRDYLAADRTMFSLERTSLAYARTSLTAFVAGVTIIKFYSGLYFQIIGAILIALGVVIAVFGTFRHRINKMKLSKFLK